jgi:asparagine synthase (glutamine-hydrolysing)
MCGISGIIKFPKNLIVKEQELEKMGKVMEHRGPDESGNFIHKNVGLVHNRLSIIDLKTGTQPIYN